MVIGWCSSSAGRGDQLVWVTRPTSRTRNSNSAKLFVQVARQGALNLTTIDCQSADADVQRILDSATGTFYDDFSKRSQPFIDVVSTDAVEIGRHGHRGGLRVLIR